jgi:3-oxoacyl-[acyl-carrier protein] reductase
MSDLIGRSFIVTGGGTGIGAATVDRLAMRGANVAVNYSRSAAAAEAVASRCAGRSGDVVAIQADVANDHDCRRLAQEVDERWGRLDGLVNNAGITKYNNLADLEGLTGEDFLNIYAVNVVGSYQMIRACAGALRRDHGGAVVNVSSVAGVTGAGSSAAYAASKGAMNTLTLSLARALGPEIRVNAVCPGFVTTDFMTKGGMAVQSWQEFDRTFSGKAVLRRAGKPDDIARSIEFLLTGDPNMTGQVVVSDSGIRLA